MPHDRPTDAHASIAPPSRELHVLCVDDDVAFLKSLECFLPDRINSGEASKTWYRFLFMSNPAEALDALRELADGGETVAMLISDQKMPQMRGTEFLSRARDLCKGTIRVLLTGHAGIDAAISAINDQLLDRYLTKPINNEADFLVNVRDLLQQFDMRQTIDDQDRVIREIYNFSNALNSLDDIPSTLRCVTEFTRGLLHCNASVLCLSAQSIPELPALEHLGSADDVATRVVFVEGEAHRLMEAPMAWRASVAEELPWSMRSSDFVARHVGPGPIAFATLASGAELLGVLCVSGPESGSLEESEMRSLVHIADTAAIALKNQFSRSRLETAYLESRRQSEELAQVNARLRILDRLKGDFLSFISHELRTPLNLLMPVTFLERCEEPTQRAHLVESIKKGYGQLERFVIQGLDYFSWLSRERIVSPEITSVADVARAAGSRGASAGPGPAVELDLPDSPCNALIPRQCLEEVLGVVLDNARKHGGEAQWTRIQVVEDPKRIRLLVHDRGVGFPPELADELFRPFTIADALHHHSGHALSLALAAAIIDCYGGHMSANSTGPGQGATFMIEIPGAGPVCEAKGPHAPGGELEAA